jgi:hypothetical protein
LFLFTTELRLYKIRRLYVAQRREILTVIITEIGPYSGPLTLAKLDGRTREAALMRRVRAELTAHCGGNPSFPQRCLIDRAATLALRIAQIEAKMLTGETLTLHDNNHAIAWHNAYRRTLAAIGLEPAATRPSGLTLADLRREAAERGAAA